MFVAIHTGQYDEPSQPVKSDFSLDAYHAKLQHEIEQRKLVEIAKGILMRELDLSEAASHRFIQKKSRDERAKVWEVAKRVIESFGSLEERSKTP